MTQLASSRSARFAIRLLALFSFALFAAWPRAAQAATTITGGNVINQTWTAAGSPYIVQGDVTVPAGAFLTIQAGTVVQFASNDGQAAGLDTNRVELTVKGTLTVNGTAASHVTFSAQSGSGTSTWYGVVVDAAATSASLAYADVRNAYNGVQSSAPGSVLSYSGGTIDSSTYGVYLKAGSPTIASATVSGTTWGIYAVQSASPIVTGSVVRGSSSSGIYVNAAAGTNVSATITGCTIDANGSYGVYIAAASGSTLTLTLKNSIVTNQASYGIYRSSGGGTVTADITYSDVWGNGTDYANVTLGAGCFSANPIYKAQPTDLQLTTNSPARFAGDTKGDIGALPYAGAPAPGLYGTLWTDTTLAASGSPYTVAGDLTVAAGVKLTLQPGVTLQFATNDVMRANKDLNRVELIVAGTLVAAGTKAQPVTFTSPGSGLSAWRGIELMPGTTNDVLSYIAIEKAYTAIYSEAPGSTTVSHAAISSSTYGGSVVAGSMTFDATLVRDGTWGLYATQTASLTVTNSVVRTSSSSGVYINTSGGSAALSVVNSTVHANGSYGIYLAVQSGSSLTAKIKNSIVTNQASYGIYRSSGGGTATIDVSYSDLWGNGTNYANVTLGTGCISQNPNYAAAPADLSLAAGSVCVDAGDGTGAPDHDFTGAARPLDGDGINGAAWDIGAYELAGAASCGDGIVQSGETCDDGAQNGTYGHCKADCSGMGPRCGDGTPNGPEQCDDGNASNADACTNACKNAACGDGYVQAGEQCDDGNASNTDACTNACESATCGDGFVQPGEQCDDANANNTDACTNACKNAACGDGFVQAGEQCDDGNAASNDGCSSACNVEKCGDGVVQSGEQCDDGNASNTDACTNACKNAACGDGFVQAGEQCDDGNFIDTDACVSGCKAATCGDGFVRAGVEACDDGNQNDADGCTNQCTQPGCGDGVVQAGEACDDGNADDTDGCLSTCLAASCGDGFVHAGYETCDDGNQSNDDACLNTCAPATCGDGFVEAGVEDCDDGNHIDTDGCVTGCKAARCGDGFVQAGVEACDDGNVASGDGCSATCELEGVDGGAGAGGAGGASGAGGTDGGAAGAGGDAGTEGGTAGAGGGGAGAEGGTAGAGGGGAGAEGGTAGAGGVATDAGAAGASGAAAAETSGDSGGCGCRVAGASRGTTRGLALAIALGLAVLARRRRRGDEERGGAMD